MNRITCSALFTPYLQPMAVQLSAATAFAKAPLRVNGQFIVVEYR